MCNNLNVLGTTSRTGWYFDKGEWEDYRVVPISYLTAATRCGRSFSHPTDMAGWTLSRNLMNGCGVAVYY